MVANTEILKAPELPERYDIVPIHASDIASFLRCRRYWDWSSPTRTNLRRKVQIFGINFPLWFGSGIHYALEMYYHPVLKRDPVEAFTTWFTYQWEGGVVTEDWLERTYDINPIEVEVPTHDAERGHYPTTRMYRIKGLRDLHPDPDESEFMEARELGIGMMEFYRDYAKRNDDFAVIAAESQFSVPLGFMSTDVREESPNYGKKLEVHARGKRDAILQDLDTGKYGLIDYKTKSKIDDAYFESLNKDAQVTNYMWASQEEARIYDLPYKRVEFITHQAMRKVFPKPPTVLKDGKSPSLDRQNESTTAELFEQYVRENDLISWFNGNQKAQLYYQWLLEKGDENFIVRTKVYRNEYELQNQGNHIRQMAREMLDPNVGTYPHPTGDYLCIHCAFRGPCIAADDGSDYQYILKDGYEVNRDR